MIIAEMGVISVDFSEKNNEIVDLLYLLHPEGTSIGSDNCDLLKVSDFNGSQ